VRFKAGLWRKLLITDAGIIVHMADDNGFLNIPEGNGWK
jgi:hypothetical protein